jgi:uncharacterized protein involved in exopolysaccharide biosynthesis
MDRTDNERARAGSGQNGLNLVDDLGAWVALVSRQWLKMVATFILVMIAVGAIVLVWPRSYQSNAKFLVRNARQDLVVKPGADSTAAYRDGVSEETLNSEIELLRSRDLLTQVVADTNLVRAEADEDRNLAVQRAVRSLNRDLDIHVIRKTNLIEVRYSSREPKHAAQVVARLADGYLARHLAIHSSPGTYEFFSSQAVAARKDLEQAEEELAQLARSANLVVPDEQRRAALEAASSVEAELAAAKAEMREANSRLAAANSLMAATDRRVLTEERTMPYQASVERLQTILTELRNKRTELLTRFNDSDRLVTEIDRQIADTGKDLESLLQLSSTEQATDVNTHWESLQAEAIAAKLRVAGLAAKAEQLEAQLAAYRNRAVAVTAATPTYERLLRTVNDARSEYELYVKKEEEARVAEALDQQKISNVVLAEAPVPSYVPSGPDRRLALFAGGVLGGLMALGVAVVSERRGHGPMAARFRLPAGPVVVAGRPMDAAEA